MQSKSQAQPAQPDLQTLQILSLPPGFYGLLIPGDETGWGSIRA